MYCPCDDYHQQIFSQLVQDPFLWIVEDPNYDNFGYIEEEKNAFFYMPLKMWVIKNPKTSKAENEERNNWFFLVLFEKSMNG